MSFHVFLSTPSARRATCALCSDSMAGGYFYPRPPRGGRLMRMYILSSSSVFLSTPSARRATYILSDVGCIGLDFYPRPPRGGRLQHRHDHAGQHNFYPRPPRGGRQHDPGERTHRKYEFLSPPSARRATWTVAPTPTPTNISIPALREEGDRRSDPDNNKLAISIPALREEGDKGLFSICTIRSYFYPRPPRGGRQQKQRQNLYFQTNYTTFCTNLEEP